jgi:integrase
MKYVTAERDRHGKTRYRFRAPWCRKWMTERNPNSPAFLMEYGALLANRPTEPAEPIEIEKPVAGTLNALIAAYTTSKQWRDNLAPRTRKGRSNIYTRIIHTDWRDRVVETLTPKDGRAFAAAFGGNGLKAVRPMFQWAFKRGELDVIPWRDVTAETKRSRDGFKQWKPEHIKAYVETHERGSMAYLALVIMLTTGLRRGDVATFGPQHVKDGWYSVPTGKTGMTVEGPVHPLLADAIEATRRPAGAETFILTEYGVPHATSEAFGSRMAKWRNQAELPADLAPCHGLRKAFAALVAERGGSEYEVMTGLGHTSPRQSATYTRNAARRGLAEAGAKRLADLTL